MPSKQWAYKELEAIFEQIGHKPAAAIALRAALRVLPLLAESNSEKNQDFLWFWQEDKAEHLLAILRAYDVGFTLLHIDSTDSVRAVAEKAFYAAHATSDIKVYYVAKAAAIVANVAIVAYAHTHAYAYAADAADAARAARTARTAAYSAYSAYSARAAYSAYSARAADTAYPYADFVNALEADFKQIQSGELSLFLQQPLWLKPPATDWFAWSDTLLKQMGDFGGGSFAHWVNWYQDRVDGKPIDWALQEKRLHIPGEIEAQGVSKINAYLAELSQATSQSNRVRALFIGKGEAGKTSLIRALHGEKVVAGKEEPTPGIDIRDWSVADTDLKAVL